MNRNDIINEKKPFRIIKHFEKSKKTIPVKKNPFFQKIDVGQNFIHSKGSLDACKIFRTNRFEISIFFVVL